MFYHGIRGILIHHQYEERGLNKSSDHVTLGKITFDDSALTTPFLMLYHMLNILC